MNHNRREKNNQRQTWSQGTVENKSIMSRSRSYHFEKWIYNTALQDTSNWSAIYQNYFNSITHHSSSEIKVSF